MDYLKMMTGGVAAHFRPILLGAGLTMICGVGCQSDGSSEASGTEGMTATVSGGSAEADSSDSTGLPEENCIMLEPEVACGSFEFSEECEPDASSSSSGSGTSEESGAAGGTAGGPGSSGTTGTGQGTTGSEVCSAETCVLQAIADGRSFSFSFDLSLESMTPTIALGFGSRSYAVDIDGSGWEEGDFSGGPSPCSKDVLRSRRPVALADCTDLACVVLRLDRAEDEVVCRQVETCSGPPD